jgi:hypothetical protein
MKVITVAYVVSGALNPLMYPLIKVVVGFGILGEYVRSVLSDGTRTNPLVMSSLTSTAPH